jgi:hypothetical protein
MYHNNNVVVPTVKRGVFVTPDNQIQLIKVDHQTESHHKFESMIAYNREHITVLHYVFGIESRVWHPNIKLEQDRVARNRAITITTIMVAGVTEEQVRPMASPVLPMPVPFDLRKNT